MRETQYEDVLEFLTVQSLPCICDHQDPHEERHLQDCPVLKHYFQQGYQKEKELIAQEEKENQPKPTQHI